MIESGFDACEFLRVATDLVVRGCDEATLRIAVGRADYAIFLHALRVTGTRRQRDFHERVITDLETADHPRLARQIGSVRRLREVADYHSIPQNRHDADWGRTGRMR